MTFIDIIYKERKGILIFRIFRNLRDAPKKYAAFIWIFSIPGPTPPFFLGASFSCDDTKNTTNQAY